MENLLGSTVLGVSLIDMEMIERGEKRSSDMWYTSVGQEGFRVFQAWGERGYRLDQYLMKGSSRLRPWKEAKAFLKPFRVLVRSQASYPI
jgi:hypothetical protein